MTPEQQPRTADDLYLQYLERHPGHISDLIFVLESKAQKAAGGGQ